MYNASCDCCRLAYHRKRHASRCQDAGAGGAADGVLPALHVPGLGSDLQRHIAAEVRL